MAARRMLHVFQAATVLCAMSSTAHGQTPSALIRGQEIAERACAGCHAIDGQQGGTIQGAAVPSLRAIAGRPDWTRERLQAFIMTPHQPMPGIPLSLADVKDVAAYIRSLR
jgi:mono/diheme cytochrome c family protein